MSVTLLQLAACSSTHQADSRTPTQSEPAPAAIEPSSEPAGQASAASDAAAAEYPREIQIGMFGLTIPPVPTGTDNVAACDAYLGEARQGGPLLLGTQTAATADSVTAAQLNEFVRVALAFIAASDGELRTVLERVSEPATLRSVLLASGDTDAVAPPAQADVDALLSVCAAFS